MVSRWLRIKRYHSAAIVFLTDVDNGVTRSLNYLVHHPRVHF